MPCKICCCFFLCIFEEDLFALFLGSLIVLSSFYMALFLVFKLEYKILGVSRMALLCTDAKIVILKWAWSLCIKSLNLILYWLLLVLIIIYSKYLIQLLTIDYKISFFDYSEGYKVIFSTHYIKSSFDLSIHFVTSKRAITKKNVCALWKFLRDINLFNCYSFIGKH